VRPLSRGTVRRCSWKGVRETAATASGSCFRLADMDLAPDALTAALDELKLRCEPLPEPAPAEGWRRTFPLDAVSLHVVVGADCLIRTEVKLWRHRLERGEVLVVNRGVRGELRPVNEHDVAPEVLSMRVHLDARHGHPLVAALPQLIRATPARIPRSFGPAVDALLEELSIPVVGREAIVRRLGEVLFVQALREHVSDVAWDDEGWFRALADPVLRDHLNWAAYPEASVSSLATAAVRSTRRIRARFEQFAGVKPSTFLRDARLRRAAELLSQGEAHLERIAALSGYGSRQALARAFRRRLGVSPTDYWRQENRRPFPRLGQRAVGGPTPGSAPHLDSSGHGEAQEAERGNQHEVSADSGSGWRDPAEPE
jgi:AraC-like DNA-binding protein